MSAGDIGQLETLYKIARALHEPHHDAQAILEIILHMAGEAIGTEHGSIVTFRRQGGVKRTHVLRPVKDGGVANDSWNVLVARGLIGFTYYGQRTIVIRDITTDPRWLNMQDRPSFYNTGSAIGIPLMQGDTVYGVMTFIHSGVDFFDPPKVSLLEEVAAMASAAIGKRDDLDSARESEAHYRRLFEDALLPIIITNLDGFIIDANRHAREFLGYEREQLLGLLINTVHRIGNETFDMERFEALQMGHELEIKTTASTANHEEIPVLVRARRLSFKEGDMIEWVEQDITAQLELEQLRGDLSAMVYHDLRGPLQNISTSLTILRRTFTNSGNLALPDMLQVALRSSRQLSRMVESLLDIQRLEEGNSILNRQSTSLYNLLSSAAELVEPLAEQSNQTLTFEMEKG
ncbi:MAG: PAS domain S-box protein, partial [Burkholderiales bacterium]|nr:PAS domain S-box protein [Anaerolineae bacterium]